MIIGIEGPSNCNNAKVILSTGVFKVLCKVIDLCYLFPGICYLTFC
jgi:hypothetical protein